VIVGREITPRSEGVWEVSGQKQYVEGGMGTELEQNKVSLVENRKREQISTELGTRACSDQKASARG